MPRDGGRRKPYTVTVTVNAATTSCVRPHQNPPKSLRIKLRLFPRPVSGARPPKDPSLPQHVARPARESLSIWNILAEEKMKNVGGKWKDCETKQVLDLRALGRRWSCGMTERVILRFGAVLTSVADASGAESGMRSPSERDVGVFYAGSNSLHVALLLPRARSTFWRRPRCAFVPTGGKDGAGAFNSFGGEGRWNGNNGFGLHGTTLFEFVCCRQEWSESEWMGLGV